MDVVDALAHRGRFFRVLQHTARSQTAVMTIDPGADAGPEEEHDGDQIIYVVEGEALVRIDGAQGRGRGPRHDPRPDAPPRDEFGRGTALLRDRVRTAG